MQYLLVLGLLLALAQCQVYTGPTWQGYSKQLKTSDLWNATTDDTTPNDWPGLGILQLFIENMDITFDTVGDDMPRQVLGLQRRPKLVHTVGAVALAVWEPLKGHNYSGVFAGGCSNMIIRFSLASEPQRQPRGCTPGIALKCLRTGVPSANIFGMFSVEGQDSFNFFKHDFTNHVPGISKNADTNVKRVASKFSEASDWPNMLGVANWAEIDDMGRDAQSVNFPFRLIYHPSTSVRNSFKDSWDPVAWPGTLVKTLKPGPLYTVYAQDSPLDDPSKFSAIGKISLTTSATTSYFADRYLFFEHQRMEDDLAYFPGWKIPAQNIVKQQESIDYYTYPDLPFN